MAKEGVTGAGVGVIVECEGGTVVVPNYSGAIVFDKDGKEMKKFEGSEDHFKNFINACRSRRVEDLNADILEGHLSSALCHTGNISAIASVRRKRLTRFWRRSKATSSVPSPSSA
jgi:hypothetical protein